MQPKEEQFLHHTVLSFNTNRGMEQKRDKMCVLGMDEKGDLYLDKFALLCKNEIIKRLMNGSYHLAEPSDGPSQIGNFLIKLILWHKCDFQCKQLTLEMIILYSLPSRMYILSS